MWYIILTIVFIMALILIFRDDHDGTYDKNEKSGRKTQNPKPIFTASVQVEKDKEEQGEQSFEPEEIDIEQTDDIEDYDIDEDNDDDDNDDEEEIELDDLDLDFLEDIEYDEDLEEDTLDIELTGLRYHISFKETGLVYGTICPEPDNPHDPNAQAAIRFDGKTIGYIPRTMQGVYEDFNYTGEECPFIGKVILRPNGYLTAEVRVIIPVSQDYVEEEFEDYLSDL